MLTIQSLEQVDEGAIECRTSYSISGEALSSSKEANLVVLGITDQPSNVVTVVGNVGRLFCIASGKVLFLSWRVLGLVRMPLLKLSTAVTSAVLSSILK